MFDAYAMTQVGSHQPVAMEASPCGICGGRSGTVMGFSPYTLVFPCYYYLTGRGTAFDKEGSCK